MIDLESTLEFKQTVAMYSLADLLFRKFGQMLLSRTGFTLEKSVICATLFQ